MEKKMELATRTSSIPEEIIFEIFSWLPVKSLMRFKCVSRYCNSLVSESAFVDIHQCHSTTRGTDGIKLLVARQYGYLYTIEQKEEEEGGLHIEDFTEDPLYDLITCVNGLFCCSMKPVEYVAIFNPCTKVVRSLPFCLQKANVDCPDYFYSIGFDPEEKTYKVLMTLNELLTSHVPTRNWVFTLGTDKSWREIKGIVDFIVKGKNVVYISGVIYMLNCVARNTFVVAFDVKTEKFRVITLWNSSSSPYHRGYCYNITKVNGKLAILDKKDWEYCEDNIDLWIREEGRWEKHSIRIPTQWTSPEFCSSLAGEILFTKENKESGKIHLFVL